MAAVAGAVPSAQAASGPVYSVMNTSESPPDGVYFRNSPAWNDTTRTYGLGVFMGERVQLECHVFGQAVGGYNNRLWYYVTNVSRPSNGSASNRGLLNAHYVNDGLNANVVHAGVPACVNNTPPPGSPQNPSPPNHQPSVTPCVFNMKWNKLALTFSYGGKHRYYGNAWQAAKNWTDMRTGLSVTPATGKADIVFSDYYEKDGNAGWVALPIAWKGPKRPDVPFTSVQPSPNSPAKVTIFVNQREMDRLDDAHRTYVLTHELGHALGLGHSDVCTSHASVMKGGGPDVARRTVLKPQYYDRIALQMLYGLPRR